MTQDNCKRIAMWSGPRNISTAMMRSFENRSDTTVIDEPFYAYYLAETGLDHPGRDAILASQPTDAKSVIKALLAPVPAGIKVFYQKMMTHHLLSDIDLAGMDCLTHVFLLRDPRAMIASYVNARDQISLMDIGMLQMQDLFSRTCDRLGAAPPVLNSQDVLKNPEKALRALCTAVDIDFDPAMLSWPAGCRESDGVWAPHWYDSVIKSTGFNPFIPKIIKLTPEQENIADHCLPIYEKIQRYALKI